MRKETCYGIIPLRFDLGFWQVLLIQHHAGHWAFPKGHADLGESNQQVAERELFEETGLQIERYLTPDPLIENYYFTLHHQLVYKTVYYFLALVKGHLILQEKEIKAGEWLALSSAHEQMTFKEGKRVCQQMSEFLKTLDNKGNPLLDLF